MNNNLSGKIIFFLLFISVFTIQTLTAQTTPVSEMLSYTDNLQVQSGYCVDQAKKDNIGFYKELREKHNESIDFLNAAEDLYKEWNRLRTPPSRFDLNMELEEYKLEVSQQELFTRFYIKDSGSSGRYSLSRENKPDNGEKDLLTETLKMMRSLEIRENLSKAAAGFLDNISRLNGSYTKSIFGVTAGSPALKEKEQEILNLFSSLFSLFAQLEKDETEIKELLSEYLGVQGKSSLSDDEKLYEYDKIEQSIESVYNKVFTQAESSAQNAKSSAENLTIPMETEGLNLSGIDKLYSDALEYSEQVKEALNRDDKSSALSGLIKSEQLYREYTNFWNFFNAMELFTSEEIDPRDQQILNKKQEVLNLLGLLLAIAGTEDAYLVAEAAPLARNLENLKEMAGDGSKDEAIKALDDALEKMKSVIALAKSTRNTDDATGLDLEIPIVVDEESLKQHEQAFEEFLKEMSLAQEEGDFKKAADYYNKAQNELRMIEALKVNLLESRIQTLKKSFKEQTNLFLSLSKSIKDRTVSDQFDARAAAIAEKDSRGSELYNSALEYSGFLEAWEIFKDADNSIRQLNKDVLFFLKGDIRDQRLDLDKQSSTEFSSKEDNSGKIENNSSDMLDFPLPDENRTSIENESGSSDEKEEKENSKENFPVNNDQTVPF